MTTPTSPAWFSPFRQFFLPGGVSRVLCTISPQRSFAGVDAADVDCGENDGMPCVKPFVRLIRLLFSSLVFNPLTIVCVPLPLPLSVYPFVA